MRIFWISLIMICIFITSSIYLNISLQESTERVLSTINIMENKINIKDWHGTKLSLKDLQDQWREMDKPWKIFIEHEEIDKIQLRITELAEYINYKDEVLIKANLSALKYLVRHIYTKNKLTLVNIF